jgi:hypothetical protein
MPDYFRKKLKIQGIKEKTGRKENVKNVPIVKENVDTVMHRTG